MTCSIRRIATVSCALASLLVATVPGAVGTQRANAAQFDVTSTADSGPGSLRQALLAAAAAVGADDVVVQPGLGVITLASELTWTGVSGSGPVTIEGNGVVVDFDGAARGLVDDRGLGFTLRNVEITGVGGTTIGNAAPLLSEGGDMVLVNCNIHDNHVTSTLGDAIWADCGGAVLSEGGAVTLDNCTLKDNSATGEADVAGAVISEGGAVTVRNCIISGNSASGTGDGAGAILSEGGGVDVADSQILSNVASVDSAAGGGINSQGRNVVVTRTTFDCNRAAVRSAKHPSVSAAGGLLSEGLDVTVSASTFRGNVGTTQGQGDVANSILSTGRTPVVTDTTISDDTGICGPPPIESFFLPKTVRVRLNAAHPPKSSLVTVGILDTGPSAPDFASAATIDVGGVHIDVPGLTASRGRFTFTGEGLVFSVTPNPYGSSRAKFRMKYRGDLTGKVAASGPLTLRFENAAADGGCTVALGKGTFGLGKVRGSLVEPNLFVQRAHATLKGPGKDSLAVIVGIAAGGSTPPQASDLRFVFADRLDATIPASSFVRKGSSDVFAGDVDGITRVLIDYAREQIAITGKRLDLSGFVQGGNSVLLSVALGADARAVRVRMGRIGSLMKY